MEKVIKDKNVYYDITWSQTKNCNRHSVLGIPSMPGIACLFQEKQNVITYLLFYACWKSGVRNGIRDLLDPGFSQFPELIELSEKKDLKYKYAIVDTHYLDMQDIMYWLIKEYNPILNNLKDFTDSKRYKDIYLMEKIEKNENDK